MYTTSMLITIRLVIWSFIERYIIYQLLSEMEMGIYGMESLINPIRLSIKNNLKYRQGTILAPVFILLCKILTLKMIFENFRKQFFSSSKSCSKLWKKVSWSQTWLPYPLNLIEGFFRGVLFWHPCPPKLKRVNKQTWMRDFWFKYCLKQNWNNC